MWFIATWLGRILGAAILLVVVLGLGVAWFVATDQPIDATVKEKRCNGPLGTNEVVVQTKWFGIKNTVQVDHQQCVLVPQDGFVRYHVRSGHTIIYETEGGTCVWDSKVGPCGAQASGLL